MKKFQTRNLVAFFIFSIVFVFVLINSYKQVISETDKYCWNHLDNTVELVDKEFSNIINANSRYLNGLARALSVQGDLYHLNKYALVNSYGPLFAATGVRLLLDNNEILDINGEFIHKNHILDFKDISSRGEFVSDLDIRLTNANEYVIRHFVPVVRDGKTIAVVYVFIESNELSRMINADIYSGSAGFYVIDNKTDNFIVNTSNKHIQSLSQLDISSVNKGYSFYNFLLNLKENRKAKFVYKSCSSGKTIYMTTIPSSMPEWSVGISALKEIAFSQVISLRSIFIVKGLLILVIFIAYSIWMFYTNKVTQERYTLQEKLQKAESAQRAKSIFLTNISHDIRTPMESILGLTRIASMHTKNNDTVKKCLDKISVSGDYLLTLLNEVLDMSKVESEQLLIEETSNNLGTIINEIKIIVENLVNQKKINFMVDTINLTNEQVSCDKIHLNQILLNLLSNAIKFTPEGGSIRLTIEQCPCNKNGKATYKFIVQDTGIGISKDFQKKLFDPFEREQCSVVNKIQGTGLGLSIVKSIVEKMGGTISVDSDKGKGSTFTVQLDFAIKHIYHFPNRVMELEHSRALVIDGNEHFCKDVCNRLEKYAIKAEYAFTSTEAIDKVRTSIDYNEDYTLFIIDWYMQGINGIELARIISGLACHRKPVFMFTSYNVDKIIPNKKLFDFVSYGEKPLFINDLKKAMIEAVDIKKKYNLLADTKEYFFNRRALLVEDNDLNRKIIEDMLLDNGFEVVTAEDGLTAVCRIKDYPSDYFDIVLTDIKMPVLDGYDLAKKIRRSFDVNIKNLPIIALSANAFEEDTRRSMEVGINAHISKPIDYESLFQTISGLLK